MVRRRVGSETRRRGDDESGDVNSRWQGLQQPSTKRLLNELWAKCRRGRPGSMQVLMYAMGNGLAYDIILMLNGNVFKFKRRGKLWCANFYDYL